MTGVICERRECDWNDKEVCARTAIHLKRFSTSGMGGTSIKLQCQQFQKIKTNIHSLGETTNDK